MSPTKTTRSAKNTALSNIKRPTFICRDELSQKLMLSMVFLNFLSRSQQAQVFLLYPKADQ